LSESDDVKDANKPPEKEVRGGPPKKGTKKKKGKWQEELKDAQEDDDKDGEENEEGDPDYEKLYGAGAGGSGCSEKFYNSLHKGAWRGKYDKGGGDEDGSGNRGQGPADVRG